MARAFGGDGDCGCRFLLPLIVMLGVKESSSAEVLIMASADTLNTESELDTSWKGIAYSRHLLQHQGSSDACSSAYSLLDMPMHLVCSHFAQTSH